MKVTRTKKRNVANTQQVKTKNKSRRPARRYINPADQVTYTERLDTTVNNPQTFTYMDYNRNINAIEMLRKQYEDIVRMYGVDLIYYRKFNTFFLEGEENKANHIYGEDTTAEFYVSGLVRGFLNIENYNWQFNMMRIRNVRTNYH